MYVFNLIVGTGALTLPAAFLEAGWALSLTLIVMLAFMRYGMGRFVVASLMPSSGCRMATGGTL